MIELKGSKKERAVRQWFNEKHGGKVPDAKVIDLFSEFEQDVKDVKYGCLNSTIKKIREEGHVDTAEIDSVVQEKAKEVETSIVCVEDMDFPEFPLHRSGKLIDELLSDHEEGGGTYGGTVQIVIGESGVGKSTLLLDLLASMQKENPAIKPLYISSEMTKNDIYFYHKKCPAIGKLPTLLLMNHIKDGTIAEALVKEFKAGHNVIIVDSHQDIIVKLKEVMGWKSTYAESWLTNMMIEAAEEAGAAIFAIQHMTKGGQYVGSTYLKHATTAMMEILFDKAGHRYVSFSKNRRGGSAVGKRLYFSLDKESGDVIYNETRFRETNELLDFAEQDEVRQEELNQKFADAFLTPKPQEEPAVEEPEDSVVEPVETEE